MKKLYVSPWIEVDELPDLDVVATSDVQMNVDSDESVNASRKGHGRDNMWDDE